MLLQHLRYAGSTGLRQTLHNSSSRNSSGSICNKQAFFAVQPT
jgi:hypothetical protein